MKRLSLLTMLFWPVLIMASEQFQPSTQGDIRNHKRKCQCECMSGPVLLDREIVTNDDGSNIIDQDLCEENEGHKCHYGPLSGEYDNCKVKWLPDN